MIQVAHSLRSCTLLLLIALLLAGIARAETPFTYQGQLADAGTPHNGPAEMVFRLWDAEIGGTQIGGDLNRTVEVTDGLFQVVLDFGSVFDGGFRFLEIEVDGTVLKPRQAVLPVPMALMALDVVPGQFWRQGGNAGTDVGDFLGTTDNTPLEIHVGGRRAMRVEPTEFEEAPNFIGGHASNEVPLGVKGATISGGGRVFGDSIQSNSVTLDYSVVSGGVDNRAHGPFATTGGGRENYAAETYATVGGGRNNTAENMAATVGGGNGNLASGWRSTVAGGYNNTATNTTATVSGGHSNSAQGQSATIPGGAGNTAAGLFSFAAGRRAKANHSGAFVWADSTDADFASTEADQFVVRATGGAGFGEAPSDYFVINTPFGTQDDDYSFGTGALRVRIDGATRFRVLGNGGVAIGNSYQSSGVPPRGLRVSGVVHLSSLGAGGGNALCQNGNGEIAHCSSSRRYKQDIVDLDEALKLVDRLRPVSYHWVDSNAEAIGLVAEEVAEIDSRLVTVNADGQIEGVRYRQLSAVLIRALQEQRTEVARMQSEIAALQTKFKQIDELTDRNARLEARLLHLETLLSETGQLALKN